MKNPGKTSNIILKVNLIDSLMEISYYTVAAPYYENEAYNEDYYKTEAYAQVSYQTEAYYPTDAYQKPSPVNYYRPQSYAKY